MKNFLSGKSSPKLQQFAPEGKEEKIREIFPQTVGQTLGHPPAAGSLTHGGVCPPRYRVVVSYPPQSEAEIELKEGDVVFVHKKREDGWYKGTLQRNGRTGLFPGSFVESF